MSITAGTQEPEQHTCDQARECLEIFVRHAADTSIHWGRVSVLEMAINNTIQTQTLWIEPLVTPETIVSEDCIEDFKEALATEHIDQSLLDAVVTIGSNPDIPPGWVRLASLIQTSQIKDRDQKGGSIQLDSQSWLSDEDFADAIQISLQEILTDTLRILVQDSRFSPDLDIPWNGSSLMPILHFAIRPGSLRSIELLLQAGCNPRIVNKSNGWTILHQCAFTDKDEGSNMALLLECGISDTSKDKLGRTCWHVASEEGNTAALKVLIDIRRNTESLGVASSSGRTPLASAVLNGNVESALLLLEHCGAELRYFQSDQSLLDGAVAIGSANLFEQLHDKLKTANATQALSSSKPLDHVNMMCSPNLLKYLLNCWEADNNSRCRIAEKYLLHANDDIFDDEQNYPRGSDMDHILQRLFLSNNAKDCHSTPPLRIWGMFCEKVIPSLNRLCDHTRRKCRASLINMMFENLMKIGFPGVFERLAHLSGCRLLFRGLLARGDYLGCSWIASSVQKVIDAGAGSPDLTSEGSATELLARAVEQSNLRLAQQLVHSGVQVHAGHGFLSPAEQACRISSMPVFLLIIGSIDRALINRAGTSGRTLLQWAVVSPENPKYGVKIQQLLKLGANIDTEAHDSLADTALTMAARGFRQDIITQLLSKGANSLHRGLDGWSILHAAACTGDLRYIQPLLPPDVSDPFSVGTCQCQLDCWKPGQLTQNTTAIHQAASFGRSSFLRFMIKNSIPFDVNAVTGYPSVTPLHLASINGHLDFVELLISLKANLNAKDYAGLLAIDLAAQHGHVAVVKVLLRSGSEKPSSHSSNSIALLMSKETGWIEDGHDSNAMSRLTFETAIIRADLNWCKTIVAGGQSINTELLTRTFTPLVRAIIQGQTAIVDWLISLAVDVRNPVGCALHPSMRCIASRYTLSIITADFVCHYEPGIDAKCELVRKYTRTVTWRYIGQDKSVESDLETHPRKRSCLPV